MAKINFEATQEEHALARKIARRARDILLDNGIDRGASDISMDLIATHANGCPLDFERLSSADDFNLMHDVGGIARHLDRNTGHLGGCFMPRFAMKQGDAA